MPEFFLDMFVHLVRVIWEDRAGRQLLHVLVPLTLLIALVEFSLDLRRERCAKRVVGVLTLFVMLVASSLFSFRNFPS